MSEKTQQQTDEPAAHVGVALMAVTMNGCGCHRHDLGSAAIGADFVDRSVRMICLPEFVIMILRNIVDGARVNVKFYAGDSSANLALEMQVTIAQVQF